jgi:type VI secretion system protein ImpH
MTVAFMGLTGPVGVLPWHYTELLIELNDYKNPALEDFFNLFNHRMISLFYRAWEKHRFFISYEKDPLGSQETGFTRNLFDLIGMGTPGLINSGHLSFPHHALLRYAGLIAQRPHSASALRGILSDYFAVPVEILSFRGKWFALDADGLSRLGENHNQLGVDATAGDAIWNPQARIAIQAGPLSIEQFVDFLPNGKAFRALKDWVQFFIGTAIEFEFQSVLEASDVPEFCLSDEGPNAPRLGWMSWLKTEAFTEDARDAVFSGEERVATA